MVRKTQRQIPYERLLEQERLILRATELIAEQMQASGVRKSELAERLGTSKAHITQALAGGRNLTLRTLADMAWALRRQVQIGMLPAADEEISPSITLKLVPALYEFEDEFQPVAAQEQQAALPRAETLVA